MNKKAGDLQITIGTGGNKRLVRDAGLTMRVQGQSVPLRRQRSVDLVFVIDTTGSMSDKIEGLLHSCQEFVADFAGLGLDYRIAVVAFGDLTVPEDRVSVFKFASDVSTIKSVLQRIPRYSGGGNEGESSLEAIHEALSLPFRPDVVKAIVLITDEPALQHHLSADSIIQKLVQGEHMTFVVSTADQYYKTMAARTGGMWYLISANVSFQLILDMFRDLAAKLSTAVSDVYKLGDGSVMKYLQLKAPDK